MDTVIHRSSMYEFTAHFTSYYYTGLYLALPSSVAHRIDYEIIGTVYQYAINRLLFGCFYSSANSSCTFQISDLNTQGLSKACIIGSVPATNDSVIRSATIYYSSEGIGNQYIPLYFFIPFIAFIIFSLIVLCSSVLYYVYSRKLLVEH